MTREQVLELLATAGRNLEVCERNGDIWAIEQGGEEWAEIFPGVDMEDFMDDIMERLEESALAVSGDFYRFYEFDGFTVVWDFSCGDDD